MFSGLCRVIGRLSWYLINSSAYWFSSSSAVKRLQIDENINVATHKKLNYLTQLVATWLQSFGKLNCEVES